MKFAYLIYRDPAHYDAMSKADFAAIVDEYFAYDDRLRESGRLLSAEALERSETAVVVSVRDRQVSTTGGPFVETKEHLGGVYIVDMADLDEAVRLAAEIPAARFGRVEVRPVREVTRVHATGST
jgi:hypothetical protein